MDGYTLGLDIGSNSVGWAVVEKGGKPEIVDMGVREKSLATLRMK